MPIYLYQFEWSPTFQGAVEAEDPGKAVNKIKRGWPIKHFHGYLFEVHGARITPVPKHEYSAKVANAAIYAKKYRAKYLREHYNAPAHPTKRKAHD